MNPTDAPPELLPCPLCGSIDLFLRDIAGWELDCRSCELSLVLADDPSREGLITRWNTRASTALAGSPSPAPDALRKIDVLLRLWCPAEKQNELRQAINDAIRPAPDKGEVIKRVAKKIAEDINSIYESAGLQGDPQAEAKTIAFLMNEFAGD